MIITMGKNKCKIFRKRLKNGHQKISKNLIQFHKRKIIKNAISRIKSTTNMLYKRTYKDVKKQFPGNVHIRTNIYGKRRVVQIIFKTTGCRMRKAGSCWNCNYGATEIIELNHNKIIQEYRKKLEELNGDVLVLESFGSITDAKEFDKGLFQRVIKIAIQKSSFDTILIETHINHISQNLVEYINDLNQGKKNLGFEVGIEDMNPENRKLINKIGIDNEKLFELYQMLKKYDMQLNINLIYGFPFMTEKERIDSTYESVRKISQKMPNAAVVLFLMSIKENTFLEEMKKNGQFELPNPWGFVELCHRIISDEKIGNLITFSWFGEKEDLYVKDYNCYTCTTCKDQIIEALKRINGTFDLEERRSILSELIEYGKQSDCSCLSELRESLEFDDGKVPNKRYYEFMLKVAFENGNKFIR